MGTDTPTDPNDASSGSEVKHDVLLNLLKSGLYSDFRMKSHGKEFRLHKAVVCTQSTFFATALGGNFKESKTGEVQVDESYDLETVQRMIDFLYTGEYSVDIPVRDTTKKDSSTATTKPPSPTTCKFLPLRFRWLGSILPPRTNSSVTPAPTVPPVSVDKPAVQHTTRAQLSTQEPSFSFLANVSLYEIAHYYNIQPLKNIAVKKLKHILANTKWSPQLFADVVVEVLNKSEDDALIEPLVHAAATQAESLLKHDVVSKLEPCGAFLVRVATECGRRVGSLRTQLDLLEASNKKLEESEKKLQALNSEQATEIDKANRELNKARICHARLNRTPRCESCSHYFSCRIGTSGAEEYALVCSDCSQRHR
ncbi:hypothetical protein B0T10DRAFT_463072 [Thelonectria olida]|uniref:BTB domain-containing protein n=1 Tax=Thelonectria olida TaxID=1576542 RepID=A0A9P9AM24_9HYPO|nr:hypothetical protein B0T10DRAFT_463072 [Thelonectria olida]